VSVSHAVNVCEKVDGQIDRSNSWRSCATASFTGSLPKEELMNFLEVTPNRGGSPAYNHLANDDHIDDICSNADQESQVLHMSKIADLHEKSYWRA
jgi:myb proto-oncogene protein